MGHAGLTVDGVIERLLRSVRLHLGLDVAFVAELDGHQRVFRHVDGELGVAPIVVGGADPAEEAYCRYVVDGRLPEFLPDPSAHPISAALPATEQVPVGTHLGVPIRFSDGTVYGTLCSFARQVRDDLDERDLAGLRVVADVVAAYLEQREGQRRQSLERRRRLQQAAVGDELHMVFQPIIDLADHALVGVEALARFPALDEGPASVVAAAWDHGVGVELEVAAVRAALAALPRLPQSAYLAVNVSAATLMSAEFAAALDGVADHRLVVEVTEHAAVADYDALRWALQPLRDRGVRLAVDDAGSGFSGLRQILRLQPELIKVDADLIRDLPTCPDRQAMVAALTTFATRMGITLVAEGIETAAELGTVRVLGVSAGQGHHIGPPQQCLDHVVPGLADGDRPAGSAPAAGTGEPPSRPRHPSPSPGGGVQRARPLGTSAESTPHPPHDGRS